MVIGPLFYDIAILLMHAALGGSFFFDGLDFRGIFIIFRNITKRSNNMETLVIDRYNLPEPISRYIESDKVEISSENGRVILSPVEETPEDIEIRKRRRREATKQLHEMFKDHRYTSDDFIRDKAIEKALEGN
jgi:virulence-associated protein VagC